jgi:8-oxo-dGTP pyrophosphatase MutT (NUDIX family)
VWRSWLARSVRDAIIFSKDGKLLLGKGGVYGDAWLIPGGGIDEDESKLDALKREIREETGIDLADDAIEKIDISLTGQSEKTLRDTGERVLVEMTFYNYKVELPQNAVDISLKTEDDFMDAGWYSADEIKNMKLSPPSIATLKHLGYL